MARRFFIFVSTLIIIVALSSWTLANAADAGRQMSRRRFLMSAGAVTATVIMPKSLVSEVAKLQTGAALPLDLAIMTEGYASFVAGILNKSYDNETKSTLGETMLPLWRSYVGYGAWLKYYQEFQSDIPESERFSLESDKQFFAQVREIVSTGSTDDLFKTAFPETRTGNLDANAAARLVAEYYRSSNDRNLMNERTHQNLGRIEEIIAEPINGGSDHFEVVMPYDGVDSENSETLIRHVTGNADWKSLERAQLTQPPKKSPSTTSSALGIRRLASSIASVLKNKFAEAPTVEQAEAVSAPQGLENKPSEILDTKIIGSIDQCDPVLTRRTSAPTR